jgi:Flp pilus assembly protein TadG
MKANRILRKRQKSTGQAIVLITLTFIVLMLFLGLVVDLGQVFIAKAYLRRATDAASLAAAAQFREGRTPAEMEAAARQIIRMNGLTADTVVVETCTTTPLDPVLCAKDHNMYKKLVRVSIGLSYPLTFMTLANINRVQLNDMSVSEAASMDVVLAIDTSESMTWDAPNGNNHRDPETCNADNSCQPFKYVKTAAKYLVNKVLNKTAADEEDRMSIAVFSTGWEGKTKMVSLGTNDWTSDNTVMTNAIDTLSVYSPNIDCANWDAWDADATAHINLYDIPLGLCRNYDGDGHHNGNTFLGMQCPRKALHIDDSSVSACDSTNTGGGLFLAGNQFTRDERDKALWVVILLTDGEANATSLTTDQAPHVGDAHWLMDHTPLGYCPSTDLIQNTNRVYCQDGNTATFNSSASSAYDADDYARNAALFVGLPTNQHAIIFTIGLGNEVASKMDTNGKAYGGELLHYIAAVGDDGDPSTDPCSGLGYMTQCGNYFFSSAGSGLQAVFEEIASRIFTRLTQ